MKETLFTVGPVEMYPESLRIGGEQLPYFRTAEFSRLVLESEAMLCGLAQACPGTRVVLITASGTGAMEAAVLNSVKPGEKVLIIVGGGFGDRFREICEDDGIDHDVLRLEPGHSPSAEQIASLDLRRYKALLVNAHETTTGVRYDLQRLGDACKAAGCLFIVDAISAFLCDPIDMAGMGIDLLLTSSQKALALAPGLSIVLIGPRILEKLEGHKIPSHYFAFSRYLADAERGQTPFTPAVGVVLQLHERLTAIQNVGAGELVRRCGDLAAYFRDRLEGLPYRIFPDSPSNALTALTPLNGVSANDIFLRLRGEYGLVVTPNGGKLRDIVFRVGHMGNLDKSDLARLALALKEISK